MEANFNLGALKIVYNPLVEYVQNIQRSLEQGLSNLEKSRNVEDYSFLDIYRKLQVALKMIGLNGVVKVLDISQISLEKTKNDSENSLVIFEKNLNLLNDVENYLAQLMKGGLDQPIKLYSTYQEIAHLANQKVNIKDLFLPKMDLSDKTLQKNLRLGILVGENNKEILINNLKKTSSLVEEKIETLLHSIRTQSVEDKALLHTACKQIHDVLSELQNQKISKSYYALFAIQKVIVCLATPISNEFFLTISNEQQAQFVHNLLLVNQTLKTLLTQVEELNVGEKTGSLKPIEDIGKENLYFLITVLKIHPKLKEMPVFQQLKSVFNYDFYENQLKNIEFKTNFSQDNPESTQQMDRLVLEIKEELSVLTSKGIGKPAFTQHITRLYGITHKLHSIVSDEEDKFKDFLSAFLMAIEQVKKEQITFSIEIQKEMSLCAVLLEYALGFFIKYTPTLEEREEFESQLTVQKNRLIAAMEGKDTSILAKAQMGEKNRQEEEKRNLSAVFENIVHDIRQNEEVLDNLLREEEDYSKEELEKTLKSIRAISGVLSTLGYRDAAQIGKEINHIWSNVLVYGMQAVKEKQNEFNLAIEWMSGLSLFAQAGVHNDTQEMDAIEDKLLDSFNRYQNKEVVEDNIKEIDTNNLQPQEETVEEPVVGPIVHPEVSPVPAPVPYAEEKEIQQQDDIADFMKDDIIKTHEIEPELPIAHNEPMIFAQEPVNEEKEDVAMDDELLDTYLEEVNEVNELLQSSFNKLKADANNKDALVAIRRGYHTLKGSGRMVGLENLGEVAWAVEQELNSILNLDNCINSHQLEALEIITSHFMGWKQILEVERKVYLNPVMEAENFIKNFHLTSEQDVSTEENENSTVIEEIKQEQSHDSIVPPPLFTPVKADVIKVSNTFEKEKTHESPPKLSVPSQKDAMEILATIDRETIVTPEPLLVNVAGVEIEKTLFDMFEEESNQHLMALREFVHDEKNVKHVILTHDFIRHAHTLTSISKAVNLEKFSSIASRIEQISTLSHDKQRQLNRAEMTLFRHAIDNLDIYKKRGELTLSQAHYQEIIQNMDDLMEELNREEIKEESKVVEKTFTQEELNAIIQGMTDNFKQVLASTVDGLKQEIAQIKQQKTELNLDDISSNIIEQVTSKVTQAIEQSNEQKQNTDNEASHVAQKVQNLERQIEEIKINQSEMDKAQQEGVISIRKDLRAIAGMVKKKPNKNVENVFGDEVNKTQVYLPVLIENPVLKSIFEEKISTVEDEMDMEVYAIAAAEIEELFIAINDLLESIHDNELNLNQNNTLKRHLHTLKGTVRIAGANKMGSIAHRLESLIEYTEAHSISLGEIKQLLINEIEKIHFLQNNIGQTLSIEDEAWLDNTSSSQDSQEDELNDGLESLLQEGEKHLTGMTKNHHPEKLTVAPLFKDDKQLIRLSSNFLDDILNEAGEIRLTRTTLQGTQENIRKSLQEFKNTAFKMNKNFKEIELQADTQMATRQDVLGQTFDPLEFDRYTRLQELTRFMNEDMADMIDMLTQIENQMRTQENAVVEQSILTNSILDSLMQVRLVPIESITDKFFKLVGRTAKEAQKRVGLDIVGEKTEVDRLVLDRVQASIEHLMRNSIAHGIETPEERVAKGKPARGTITFKISVDGNFITFRIQDDGKGIDLERVYALGVEKGLIAPEAKLSKEEIINLIFMPGFSTSKTISQLSGRGVGMDVVKNDILSLGGSIKTLTEPDLGTEFIITIPVAVATHQATLVKTADKLIAIPAILVSDIYAMKKSQLIQAYHDKVLTIKDKTYPLYYLGHLYGTLQANLYPEIKNYNTVLLISYQEQEILVHVDLLETTDEILIKPLGHYLSKITGFLGATLLGDGRQGLVVNPVLLKEHFIKTNTEQITLSEPELKIPQLIEEKPHAATVVMVVDDSTTVRRATQKVLEKNGFVVVLAKDGAHALEQLQVTMPDIILSDIEMPVMDGFEFLKNIRTIDRYKHLPMIMITSRTADKHKTLAYDLGVNGFLGKPYQEDELLNEMEKVLKNQKT